MDNSTPNLPDDPGASFVPAKDTIRDDVTLIRGSEDTPSRLPHWNVDDRTAISHDQLPTESEPASAATPPAADESAQYQFVRRVGSGGTGEVWEAVQVFLRRRVAVKRLHQRHEDSQAMRALRFHWFEQEACVAAALEHPNILPVHDFGRDSAGVPMLAMKLVDGMPWNELLAEDFHDLPEDEYLSRHIPILMAMAQAVAFAHSRGVVHRDLKPAQVLVGSFGEVLLTDWGLAIRWNEALELDDIPASFRSHLPTPANASNPAGTPGMMAPEQTTKDASHLGPWTDVFLLGGTLYFLLTGTFPHQAENSHASLLMASSGPVQAPSKRAPNRHIPRDLEDLCMEAMRPAPEERLESAAGFWKRLDEHIRGTVRRSKAKELAESARATLRSGALGYAEYGEVLAKVEEARGLWPDDPQSDALRNSALDGSAWLALGQGDLSMARYQANRISDEKLGAPLIGAIAVEEQHQHRRRVMLRATVVSVVILLSVIAAGSLIFTMNLRTASAETIEQRDRALVAESRARERADEAERNLELARAQERRALAAEKDADARAAEAEQNLGIARAQGDGAADLVFFVLRELKPALDTELTPELGISEDAANRASFAIAGRIAAPIVHYYEGLDWRGWPDAMQLQHAKRMSEAARRFWSMGRYREGVALARPALAIRRVHVVDHPLLAENLNLLGALLDNLGEQEEARKLYEEALELRERLLGPDHDLTSQSYSNLATLLMELGDLDAAFALHSRVFELREAQLGPGHELTAFSLNRLASLHLTKGENEAARALAERAVSIYEQTLGPEHHETGNAINSLAWALFNLNDPAAARPLFERNLRIHERSMGPEHPTTAVCCSNLAHVLQALGDLAAARLLLERAAAIREHHFGVRADTADALSDLGVALEGLLELEDALAVHQRALAMREQLHGEEHPAVAVSCNRIALVLTAFHRLEEAREFAERAIAMQEKLLGPDDHATGVSVTTLGGIQRRSREFPAARASYERALAIFQKQRGPDHQDIVTGMINLGNLLGEIGEHTEGMQMLAQALAIRERVTGPDSSDSMGARRYMMILHARWVRRNRLAGVDEARLRKTAEEGLAFFGEDTGREKARDLARAHHAELLHFLGQREEARAMVEVLLADGYPTPAESDEDRAGFAELCASLSLATSNAR